MNAQLILFLFILLIVNNSGCYAITPEESRNEQYLINHGYSKETARLVKLQDKQIKGQTVKDDSKCNKGEKLIQRIQAYIDPAVDKGDFGSSQIDETEPVFTNKKDPLWYEKGYNKLKSVFGFKQHNKDL